MNLNLLVFVPALCCIVWAAYVKYRGRSVFDLIMVIVSGMAVLLNGFIVSHYFYGLEITTQERWVQGLLSSTVVPLAYMYFARQMGRRWDNSTTLLLWALFFLFLVPNGEIFVGEELCVRFNVKEIAPLTFHFYSGGEGPFVFHTSDAVIGLQALLTLHRLIALSLVLKHYRLTMSRKVHFFLTWWVMAILFILYTSCTPISVESSCVVRWVYYIWYTLLICTIYIMLSFNFDLRPQLLPETLDYEEDENNEQTDASNNTSVSVGLDKFIEQSHVMAKRVREIINEERVYLIPGYSSKDIIAVLGTNRTYFSRMMLAEFGCTFSTLITQERIRHAQYLLSTTSLTVAEVGERCGFSNGTAFSAKFKEITGATPAKWKKGEMAAAEE